MKTLIEIVFSVQSLIDVVKPVDITDVEKIAIVTSSNPEKLVGYFKQKNVKYDIIGVMNDFESISEEIARYITRNRKEEFLVNLINVPPIFVIASLSAFLLTNIDGELVFPQSIRVRDIIPPTQLDEEHKQILKVLNDGKETLVNISKSVGLPITTAWRRMNELINEEIITREYALTRKGRILKATISE